MAKGNVVTIDQAVDAAIAKISFEANLRWIAVRLSPTERATALRTIREMAEGVTA